MNLCFRECSVVTPSARARDAQLAKRFWDLSVELVNLRPEDNVDGMLTRCGTS